MQEIEYVFDEGTKGALPSKSTDTELKFKFDLEKVTEIGGTQYILEVELTPEKISSLGADKVKEKDEKDLRFLWLEPPIVSIPIHQDITNEDYKALGEDYDPVKIYFITDVFPTSYEDISVVKDSNNKVSTVINNAVNLIQQINKVLESQP